MNYKENIKLDLLIEKRYNIQVSIEDFMYIIEKEKNNIKKIYKNINEDGIEAHVNQHKQAVEKLKHQMQMIDYELALCFSKKPAEYDDESFEEKILNVITLANRCVSNSDIAHGLIQEYPSIRPTKEDYPNFKKSITTTLSRLKKKKAIDIYKPDGSNKLAYWYKPEWIDDKGKIKDEHAYKDEWGE